MPLKSEEPADVPLPSTEDIIPPSSIGPAVPGTLPRNSHRYAIQTLAPDVVGHTPMKTSSASNFLRRSAVEEQMIPPSSPIMARKMTAVPDSPAIPMSAVKPSSRPSSFASRLYDGPETPIKNRSAPRPFAKDLPTPKRSSVLQPASRPGVATSRLFDVPETPVKQAAAATAPAPPPPAAGPAKKGAEREKETSIYQRLGWDDDDDLDDLM